jgi:para-nitrobenzyl esterase
VPANRILDAVPDFSSNPPRAATNGAQSVPPPFRGGITVDGHVLKRAPAQVFAAGEQHRVPFLVGNNAREKIPGPAPKDLASGIADTYGPLASRAQALYVGTDPIYGSSLDQWVTDTTFRCSAVTQLVWHARAKHPAFEYEFARAAAGREALGATHAAELSHLFGTLDRGVFGVGPPGPPPKATDIDWRISEVMQLYWTNFAKNGDPNGPGLPTKWPRFDLSSRAYVQFTDAGPIAKDNLRRAHCDLFIENVKRLMSK